MYMLKALWNITFKNNSFDLYINHRSLKHEPFQNMFILNICVTMLNWYSDEGARTVAKFFLHSNWQPWPKLIMLKHNFFYSSFYFSL